MVDLKEIAKKALEQMPPEARFSPEDAQVIARHRDLLLSWSEEFVQAFYDTLFAHPPTRALFREGERPEGEETLRGWWRRTVEGPLDETYFAWMVKVGLAHVYRKVENPMMLAMADFAVGFVGARASSMGLVELAVAFNRLMGSVRAVIAYGYDFFQKLALHNVVGMEPALLDRLSLEEARSFLGKLKERG
ncbi:protoglobin domain-containing protein [Thermus sp.]|uniref:protoglobin domain-containing protein n=1 Tax=Thermus sp. TaxID=275 RepID=UPI003D0FB3E5